MSTVRSLGLSALLALLALSLSVTGLIVAPPSAGAACAFDGENYTDNGYTAFILCDTFDECAPYVDQFIEEQGTAVDVYDTIHCSEGYVDPVEETPDPLGDIPEIEGPVVGAEYDVLQTCYASSCTGIDPALTDCLEDAVTIYSRWAEVNGVREGHAEMRYSEKCHANWVRVTPTDGGARSVVNLAGRGGYISAAPYIWQKGVDGTLQGTAGNSNDVMVVAVTSWTGMVSADGATCWSVEFTWNQYPQNDYELAPDKEELGTWEGGCVE